MQIIAEERPNTGTGKKTNILWPEPCPCGQVLEYLTGQRDPLKRQLPGYLIR